MPLRCRIVCELQGGPLGVGAHLGGGVGGVGQSDERRGRQAVLLELAGPARRHAAPCGAGVHEAHVPRALLGDQGQGQLGGLQRPAPLPSLQEHGDWHGERLEGVLEEAGVHRDGQRHGGDHQLPARGPGTQGRAALQGHTAHGRAPRMRNTKGSRLFLKND